MAGADAEEKPFRPEPEFKRPSAGSLSSRPKGFMASVRAKTGTLRGSRKAAPPDPAAAGAEDRLLAVAQRPSIQSALAEAIASGDAEVYSRAVSEVMEAFPGTECDAVIVQAIACLLQQGVIDPPAISNFFATVMIAERLSELVSHVQPTGAPEQATVLMLAGNSLHARNLVPVAAGDPHASGMHSRANAAREPRTREGHANFLSLFLPVIEAVQNASDGRSLTEVLRRIKDARAMHARSSYPYKGSFVDDLKELIAENLSGEERDALARALRRVKMRELRAVLREVGRTAAVKMFDALPDELRRLESALCAMRTAADPAGEDESPCIPQLAMVSPAVRETLRAACAIEIETNESVSVVSGAASRNVRTLLGKELRSIVEAPQTAADPEELADYVLDGAPLVDKEELTRPGTDRQQVLLAADRKLMQWTSDAPAMLRTLRRVASGGATGALTGAIVHSPDNPFRLADGTPFIPSSAGRVAFSIRRNGRNGLVVTCRWRFPKTTRARVIDPMGRERVVALDEPVRTGLSWDIKISPDGAAALVPASVDFWRGSDVPDEVSELTRADANPYLVDELIDFLEREHSMENISFIRALNEFDKIGSLEEAISRAEGIRGEYVAQGAPQQVNLPAQTRQAIKDAIERASSPDLPDAERHRLLTDAFAAAREAIAELMRRDTYRRFLSQARSNLPAQALPNEPPPPPEAHRRSLAEIDGDWLSMSNTVAGKLNVLATPLPSASLVQTWVREIENLDLAPGAFAQHVSGCLNAMPLEAVASLVYNLDGFTPPGQDTLPRVGAVLAAARARLRGTREGRMTPEGVLLETVVPARIDMRTLSAWLAGHRVNEEEVATFFQKLGGVALHRIHTSSDLDEDMVRIVGNVLRARREQIEFQGTQLAGRIRDSVPGLVRQVTSPGAALLLSVWQIAASLASSVQRFQETCQDNRVRGLSTSFGPLTRPLAAALIAQLREFGVRPPLDPRRTQEYRSTLIQLGGALHEVDEALRTRVPASEELPPPPGQTSPSSEALPPPLSSDDEPLTPPPPEQEPSPHLPPPEQDPSPRTPPPPEDPDA
ncbi:MAG TPA: hypothetical protein VHA82_12860 [Ramlibacter sp.]|uniref:hypothetical protein n=1 Tax=Ramlibacter sp. TaxID=1917967 RepID=UPI002B583D7A|nr:hypothetical protein [Ramlibacter sp.]HVZ44693.1 hypothetical protein [Ramlibacter sp.]